MFNNILPLIIQNMFNNDNQQQQQQINYFNNVINNFMEQFNNLDFETAINSIMNNLSEDDNECKYEIELKEFEDKYIVDGILPNINKGDIDLDYDKEELKIHIRRKEIMSQNNGVCISMLQINKDIHKKFMLKDVQEERIVAVFKNEELKIVLPKKNRNKECNIIDVIDYIEN